MRILVDENIPGMTVDSLRGQGHDVRDLRGSPREGLPDEELWTLAQGEQRLLVTTDKGFASHRGAEHFGVLIVRLRQPNRQRIHDRVMTAIDRFDQAEWPGTVVIMRDRAVSVWRPTNEA